MSNQIGIIDEPVSPGNDDKLDIKRHSKALTRFMENWIRYLHGNKAVPTFEKSIIELLNKYTGSWRKN